MILAMSNYEFPANEVRPLRKSLKMTQVEFAEYLGVTQGLISQWEQGQRTPNGPAAKLLTLLQRGVRLQTEIVA